MSKIAKSSFFLETRESAFIEAMQVAAVASLVHEKCTNGDIKSCGCNAMRPDSDVDRTSVGSNDAERNDVISISRIPSQFLKSTAPEDCEDSFKVAQRFARQMFERPLESLSSEDPLAKSITLHNFKAGRMVSEFKFVCNSFNC